MLTAIFFVMIVIQSAAYLWFQAKAGVVSHKKYMIANGCFMFGQAAQMGDGFLNGAWASFSIALFYFAMTAFGIFQRYRMMRGEQQG